MGHVRTSRSSRSGDARAGISAKAQRHTDKGVVGRRGCVWPSQRAKRTAETRCDATIISGPHPSRSCRRSPHSCWLWIVEQRAEQRAFSARRHSLGGVRGSGGRRQCVLRGRSVRRCRIGVRAVVGTLPGPHRVDRVHDGRRRAGGTLWADADPVARPRAERQTSSSDLHLRRLVDRPGPRALGIRNIGLLSDDC